MATKNAAEEATKKRLLFVDGCYGRVERRAVLLETHMHIACLCHIALIYLQLHRAYTKSTNLVAKLCG